MLRTLVLAAACLFAAGAAAMTLVQPAAWPMLATAALLLAGTVFERFHYRGAEQPGAGPWEATGERFRDERSGLLVTVWFNPATGERRYVDADEAAPH